MFIYETFPSVLHYMIDFQAAFFFPRRKVKLLLSWLLKDGVYLKSSLGFTTNLIDFEDCFPSNLWSVLCFFSDSRTLITLIINTSTFDLIVCVYACANACMHTLQHMCRSQRTALRNWISHYIMWVPGIKPRPSDLVGFTLTCWTFSLAIK